MTFDELYDALRNLAEENNSAYDSSSWTGLPAPFSPPTLSTWTLRPDHIETLVKGISDLQEHQSKFLVTDTSISFLNPKDGKQYTISFPKGTLP